MSKQATIIYTPFTIDLFTLYSVAPLNGFQNITHKQQHAASVHSFTVT